MRIFIGLTLVTLITACTTPVQQAAEQQREVDRMVQIYGPACEKLGFSAATDQWRNCVLQLDAKNHNGGVKNMSCFGRYGFVQCTSF